MPRLDTPVEELINISAVSGKWLRDEGIQTLGDLQNVDILSLWAILRSKHEQVTKNMYYVLWGALNNKHWNQIPDSEKQQLKEFTDRKPD